MDFVIACVTLVGEPLTSTRASVSCPHAQYCCDRSAVTPFVGTVDAAATALQPLALNEVEERAEEPSEDAAVAVSAARAIGSLGSQPAGQLAPQPTQPRESVANRRQLDAPARNIGGGTPPELSLPAAWQSPPPPASPPQPFASEPMQSAGEPAEAQHWQQVPTPGLAGRGLHAAASVQLVRESRTPGGADGPMAPQSRLVTGHGWGTVSPSLQAVGLLAHTDLCF